MDALATVSTHSADRYSSTSEMMSTPPASGAYYSPRTRDFVDSFYRALTAWRAATDHSSSIQDTVQCRHFRAIVDMGPKVLPLIVHELARRPDFLFIALHEITGENPVPKAARGNVRKMVDAWLLWAERSL